MKNIINKIRQVYPVSDEALQALQADMQVRYYPKNTYIVHSGVTDRLVYFIEEGVARSVFHHNKILPPGSARKVTLLSVWIRCITNSRQ